MNRLQDWLEAAVGFVLPLIPIGLFLYTHLIESLPPYATGDYDPEYAYMLSSLSILKSKPINYYHHPGTPLTIVGTFVLMIQWIMDGIGTNDFINQVVLHQGTFFFLVHAILTAAASATMYGLQRTWQKVSSNRSLIMGVVLSGSYFAAFPSITFEVVRVWNQNLFAFPIGTLFFLLLFQRINKNGELSGSEIFTWGVLSGLIWSIQFYFVAWVVGTVVIIGWVRYGKHNLIAGLHGAALSAFGGLTGFFIAFLPIFHRIREYSWWMRGLLPSGGSNSIQFFELFGQGFTAMWRGREVLLISLLFSIGLLLYAMWEARRRTLIHPEWWALVIGGLVVLIITYMAVMMASLFRRPADYYLLPLAALIPFILLLAFQQLFQKPGEYKRLARLISVVVLGFFAFSLIKFLDEYHQKVDVFHEQVAAIEQIIGPKVVDGRSSNGQQILWAKGAPSRCYALHFGNIFTEWEFSQEIAETCPLQSYYDSWSDQVTSSQGTVRFSEDIDWKYLIGLEKHMPDEYLELGDVWSNSQSSNLVIVDR